LRPDEVNDFFSIYLILSAALGPGIYSDSNSQCVELTTLPPSTSRLSRQCGMFNISHPYRPPRPVTGTAFSSLLFIILQFVFHLLSYHSTLLNVGTEGAPLNGSVFALRVRKQATGNEQREISVTFLRNVSLP
jgi:hypothetical protein